MMRHVADAFYVISGFFIMICAVIVSLHKSIKLVLAIVVFMILASLNCRGTIGGGQVKASEINRNLTESQSGISEAVTKVQRSSATEPEKYEINRILRDVSNRMEEQKNDIDYLGKATDRNKQIADDNASAANKYRYVVIAAWAISIIALCGIIIYILRKFVIK